MNFKRSGLRFEDPILGIDPSSNMVGWCVLQGDMHLSGVLKLDGEAPLKMSRYRKFLRDMVTEYRPAAVVLEEPFVSRDPARINASMVMCRFQGVAMEALAKYIGCVDWVAASSWKCAVLGNGKITTKEKNAGKIVDMVKAMGFPVTRVDQADAVCIALHLRKKFFGRIR